MTETEDRYYGGCVTSYYRFYCVLFGPFFTFSWGDTTSVSNDWINIIKIYRETSPSNTKTFVSPKNVVIIYPSGRKETLGLTIRRTNNQMPS